ncbi:MAG: RNA polymerase sigma factor [Xanthomonadales bacterium]|nr:RNA polymerase sigma factor [Xanthomonadales bacterium]
MRERSDEALMEAYAHGDAAAFERLYRRHRGPLYRYIIRYVGDAAIANDLYQGCWEKIILARQRYRPSAPFRAWMYRIAHNHVMDHFRRKRPNEPLADSGLPDPGPGPEQALAAAQQEQSLTGAVARLPPEQREAILLRLEAGLGLADIAQVTGVNPETAKSRLRYAVRKLKSGMKE